MQQLFLFFHEVETASEEHKQLYSESDNTHQPTLVQGT
jgi:hypothetical protein